MANPVEIIGESSRRIARLAAIRTMLAALGPAIAAIAIGLLLGAIGHLTWARYGYALSPDREEALRAAFVLAGIAALLAGAAMAYRAYRKADDFIATAAELDLRLAGKEQITTLANLANPAAMESGRARRTPLFPVLWRRAIMYFEGFDPAREFKLEVGEPLKRSSMLAGVVALAMMLATLGLVRAPSPEQHLAGTLRGLAEEIARTATSTDDSALAEKIREAADALENPKLPPEEKKKRIQEAMQQAAHADEKRHNSQNGKDQGTGQSKSQSAKGNGKDQSQSKASGGSGEGKSETGEGKSEAGKGQSGTGGGKGEGKSESAKNDKGQGAGKNNQNGKNDKRDQQSIELQNNLAKADAQIETANAKNLGPDNQPGEDKNKGNANKPGDNQNRPGGGQPDPNKPGDVPKPGANGDRNVASAGNPKDNKDNRDRGSNLGDTHLGEMPAAGNYQKYLKPGEKGATVDIKDARYVMFRLPGAPASGDGGKTVLDTERPRASTAYVNAPLAPSSDNAPPDERQLVPPRYRDMIR
ncbi:MAG: hypothetical protein Q7S58_02705 [Candidatus Binatus sp.]|uniref:hypothetical protein n=1 Tax=Candidatus Binatus sp. TaxID=2811406 RepID=UPI002722D57B|nr:hypothetical protein [Candidatus Binatus sp.]MDO8431303.1 hypothetical protein [Candidatus Binatus sp.]